MADPYDYQTALKNRLVAIQALSDSQTTWANFQAQKAKALQAAQQNYQEYQPQGFDPRPYIQQQQPQQQGPSGFNNFVGGIVSVESGGNYSARNRSSGAMGKYQIMPSNLGGRGSGWDYEALGYDVSPTQFMTSPQIQDKIATYKLQQYYQRYGPAGAAIAWYAGPGTANSLASRGYVSRNSDINRYKEAVLRRAGIR